MTSPDKETLEFVDKLVKLLKEKEYKEYTKDGYKCKYPKYDIDIMIFYDESEYYPGAINMIIEQRFANEDYDTVVFNGSIKTMNEFLLISKLCDKYLKEEFYENKK